MYVNTRSIFGKPLRTYVLDVFIRPESHTYHELPRIWPFLLDFQVIEASCRCLTCSHRSPFLELEQDFSLVPVLYQNPPMTKSRADLCMCAVRGFRNVNRQISEVSASYAKSTSHNPYLVWLSLQRIFETLDNIGK